MCTLAVSEWSSQLGLGSDTLLSKSHFASDAVSLNIVKQLVDVATLPRHSPTPLPQTPVTVGLLCNTYHSMHYALFRCQLTSGKERERRELDGSTQ